MPYLVRLESSEEVGHTVNVVVLDVPDLSEAGHSPLVHLGVTPGKLTHLTQDLHPQRKVKGERSVSIREGP